MRIVDNKNYSIILSNVIEEIESLLLKNNIGYAFDNNYLITDKFLSIFRGLVSCCSSSPEKLIKGQILESLLKSEKTGANGSFLFIKILINEIKNALNNNINPHLLSKKLDDRYKEIEILLNGKNKNIKWEDVVSLIKNHNNKIISNMVLDAIELAGIDGKIFPSASITGEYSVELVAGYNFPISTYDIFTSIDNGRWERENVLCLIIDGVIEKESEIHKIFYKVFETKKPLLLITRGYGEDVIATIASNKELDVCPIRIPFELDSVNILTDIAVVCGSSIVSSMKGDMINFVKYEDLLNVNNVITTKNNLNIFNSKTINDVNNHLSDLIKRRDSSSDIMFEFLNKRIQSLISNIVHIRIGAKTQQQKMKELEDIDYLLRIIKSVLSGGLMNISEIKEFENDNKIYPCISILSAFYYSFSLIKNLIMTDILIID